MADPAPAPVKNQLGTFAGVFTPSILTILGVIMFLRAGYVIGHAGIGGALGILLIAEGIVLLTALSVAAIATNTQVHGGGAYYLISRALGPEFGGAIGITLFAAQTLSVPFHILGFSEALVQTFDGLAPHVRWVCLATATILFVLNMRGIRWALNVQFAILAVLALSILFFLGGLALQFDATTFADNWSARSPSDYRFWTLFAIFFPAVTGIMAGINMSGDLRNPNRSLSRGTLLAVAVGGLIYALQILLMGGAASRAMLIDSPYGVLIANALLGAGFLVVAGMFSASISSALSSFLAAPRVVQAIARDRLLKRISLLAAGSKHGDEPRRALTLTFLITVAVLWLATAADAGAAFNRVAAIVTMFFLSTYLIINVAAFVEAASSNPSFRPRFKWFHWSTALAGAVGCGLTMILIHPGNTVIALVMIGALYAYMSRRSYITTFGDARRGFIYATISRYLLRLREFRPHPKNWRPTILILSGKPQTRLNLILYGVWLEAGRGIVTVAQLMMGELAASHDRRKEALAALREFIYDNQINAFPEVVVTPNFDEGVRMLLQGHSIGPIKPNIVLMGWPRDPERIQPFFRHVNDVHTLGMSAISIIGQETDVQRGEKRIDLWWRGQENGSLMLILAHLLTHNWEWANTRIRLVRLVEQEQEVKSARESMVQLVESARIDAEVHPIYSRDSFRDVFRRASADAAAIFVGFHPVEESKALAFHANVTHILEDMPTTLLVCSSGEADLLA